MSCMPRPWTSQSSCIFNNSDNFMLRVLGAVRGGGEDHVSCLPRTPGLEQSLSHQRTSAEPETQQESPTERFSIRRQVPLLGAKKIYFFINDKFSKLLYRHLKGFFFKILDWPDMVPV